MFDITLMLTSILLQTNALDKQASLCDKSIILTLSIHTEDDTNTSTLQAMNYMTIRTWK